MPHVENEQEVKDILGGEVEWLIYLEDIRDSPLVRIQKEGVKFGDLKLG